MKYGIMKYESISVRSEDRHVGEQTTYNIGDYIQPLAMRRIYTEEMGISEDEIVEISIRELGTYRGEYLIVPINFFFVGCHSGNITCFPCSPYMIPVFIGLHLSTGMLGPKEVDHLRYYSPIGCRDEFTLNVMRRYQIPSYLFGCVTATLPKREDSIRPGTTYLVDTGIDDEIVKRLPAPYKQDIKRVSHTFRDHFSPDMYRKTDSLAEERIREYRQNAALVVTSRLHCASPCAAMGIPTIMIVREKDQRFSWLSRLIPIYTVDELDSIDWNVPLPGFEAEKRKMISLIIDRIQYAKDRYEKMFDISWFYESELPSGYKRPFHAFFKSLDSLIASGIRGYYLWGATALAEEAHLFLKEKSCAEFYGLIDEYNTVDLEGKRSIRFSEIDKTDIHADDLIVVTPFHSKDHIYDKVLDSGIGGRLLFLDGQIVDLSSQSRK